MNQHESEIDGEWRWTSVSVHKIGEWLAIIFNFTKNHDLVIECVDDSSSKRGGTA